MHALIGNIQYTLGALLVSLNAKGNEVLIEADVELSYAFLFRSHAFFRELQIFQYFEILLKSDLLEMKQNLCIA